MTKAALTSLSNPLIKRARALRQKKARAENRLFLVEGIHHVGKAVESGWDVESLLYSPDLCTMDAIGANALFLLEGGVDIFLWNIRPCC